MSKITWQEVARGSRAALVQAAVSQQKPLTTDQLTTLALLSIALELDYLTDNLHRVGEGS